MSLFVLALATALAAGAGPGAPLAAEPPTAAAPTIPPATIDSSLEVVGDSLKARQIMSRMLVQVAVNGEGPFLFIVDSGADRSVIGADLARRLGLPRGKPVTLQSMAGARRVETVMLDRVTVGTSEVNGIAAPALDEADLGAQGLLGIDALAEQRLMLDFDRKTITIQDGRQPAQSSADEIVVTARRRNGQLILTQGTIRGRTIYSVIDTGAQVTVGNSALRALVFGARRPPPSIPTTLISVTGQSVAASLVVLPEFRLGGLILRQVQVAFADVPPFALFGLSAQPALLLGTDVLENFSRVSLDFRRRRVRFLLRRGSAP